MGSPLLGGETIASLAPRIARREISPVDLVRACLNRIEEQNEAVRALITVCADQALQAAKSAEAEILAGHYRGPLHGIPISLKDLIATQGTRTTAGSRILADWIPQADATIVTQFKKAGAILLGKANLHEFAYGPTGVNPHYGTAQNAWDPGRIPGGSSSGSAASVTHSFCLGSIGTDTGGSVRIPASLMGIVGLKPTYGLVSLKGIVPLAWSLDHAGPMTKSVIDAALMLQAIAGHDPRDPSSPNRPIPDYSQALQGDVKGLRIGLVREYLDSPMEAEVKDGVIASAKGMETLGAKVEEVSLPQLKYAPVVSFLIMASESMAFHRRFMKTRAADYGEDIRVRLGLGQFVLATQYLQAQRVRRLLYRHLREALGRFDLLLTPTLPITAPRIEDREIEVEGKSVDVRLVLTRFTRAFNVTGHPALSLPCGLSPSGLPIGVQLIGRPFAEETLLHFGHAYEQAFPFPSLPC
ncbi:MAG: amidase [candidate division NC10 bacterium]|nr:amidase [candidate division NC10 bacterium]